MMIDIICCGGLPIDGIPIILVGLWVGGRTARGRPPELQ